MDAALSRMPQQEAGGGVSAVQEPRDHSVVQHPGEASCIIPCVRVDLQVAGEHPSSLERKEEMHDTFKFQEEDLFGERSEHQERWLDLALGPQGRKC